MKSWLDSKTIRYLFATWVAGILMALVPMLQTKSIDWWSLGAQTAVSLAAIIVRMFAPDVEGPLDVMNRPPKGNG